MEEENTHSTEKVIDNEGVLNAANPNDSNDLNLDTNTISSSSVEEIEDGIVKGGHILRKRVPGAADAWRELSRTPPPSGSPTRSFSGDGKSKRVHFQNPDTPSKSFAEFSKEYDEAEERKKTAEAKGQMNKKTIEDFSFKGLQKRNASTGNHSRIQDPRFQLIIFLAIVSLVVGVMFVVSGKSKTEQGLTDRLPWHKAQIALMRDLVKLNKHFPSQNRETAIHFISAINSTLSERVPKQPSAITILTPPSMQDSTFPACFISKVASVVNQLFSRALNLTTPPVKILDKSYFKKNGNDITAIHDDLKTYLNQGGKAVMVHNVDQLEKEEHLLLFHSFCDNFKAPDKRATFFFIVPVPLHIHRKHAWNQMFGADISNDVLDSAWQKIVSDDSRPAMISRVAATVVLLNEGDSC